MKPLQPLWLIPFSAFVTGQAMAALTDLASAPLITSSSISVLPNLMFVLDDSGSMSWTHMPDVVADFAGTTSGGTCSTTSLTGACKFGYRSSQCNEVYYDPTLIYSPPVDASGAVYPNASFTAAWKNGYQTSAGTVNLSTSFYAFGDGGSVVTEDTTSGASMSGYDKPVPAYYYVYSGTQLTAKQKNYNDTSGIFYKECNSTPNTTTKHDGVHAVNTLFTKVVVSTTSGPGGTDERQNFANWFSYYRTRMLMMKTAVGRAFNPIDNHYRLGFMTINNNVSPGFIGWAPFEGSQRTSWYSKLYGASPKNSTPIREALANVGRMYAGKLKSLNSSSVTDPVQYSCQQNFTLLSTDGYWNGTDSAVKKIDGSTVMGNEDGALPRPFYDGGKSSNSLADVAQYYYATDLRTTALSNCTGSLGSGIDVCTNDVPTSADDSAKTQHMTTFTLGLGAPGKMVFSSSYLTDLSGDFFDVKSGTSAAPPGTCAWQTSGSGACNWPWPSTGTAADKPEAIDDLWHAAINGRGTYFSATNAATLAVGLDSALAGVSARTGSSAAAAVSNPNISTTDNLIVSSNFTSQEWTGNLYAQQMDATTGTLDATILWSAQAKLDANTRRTIYTFDHAAKTLKSFAWNSLTASEQGAFGSTSIKSLSQLCSIGVYCLPASAQSAAAGENLVNYLRGDRSLEGSLADTSKYYRIRKHLLGDIVNSEVAYVKGSPFQFMDKGYEAFLSSSAVTARAGMAYVGANDGMLHAFATEGTAAGSEVWAYVPTFLFSNLYKLADKNYGKSHQFFVDGSPIARDVNFGGEWHTILVGGANAGGRGYYALDVTDPAHPKALWEFTHDNLGYTYGNPVICKLKDGTWVVVVASGYNNVSPGDGKGYLFVLNAETGALIRTLETGVGSVSSPSGLAKLSAWMANAKYDYTALRVYGGDLQGNVWRFDINGNIGAAGYEAQRLATLKDAAGNLQPVTTRPELGEFNGHALVYVGTGALLGVSDLASTRSQSFYGIKDELTGSGYGVPREDPLFVAQTVAATTCPAGAPAILCATGEDVRTIASQNVVDLLSAHGWYIDFPAGGERVTNDPLLSVGIIAFNTNLPSSTACTLGGYSFRYFLDARTGSYISSVGTHIVAQSLGKALANRPIMTSLSNGTLSEVIQTSDGKTVNLQMPKPPIGSTTRRLSWRELPTD